MREREIKIHDTHKAILKDEFGVSMQTIRMSLKYVFNKGRNKKIRARAIELLQKEVEEHKKIEA